jgi:hypothetical protein
MMIRPTHIGGLSLLIGALTTALAAGPESTDGAEGQDDTVHLAIAGGGFYSQTNATGWLAGMLDLWAGEGLGAPLANVQTFTGISGGSWMLTQIGYSDNFNEQLRTNRDGWTDPAGYLGQVRTTFEGFEAFDCTTLPGTLEELCDSASFLNPVFSVLQSSGDILDPRWQEVCEDIVFSQYGMKNELQGVRLADASARTEWAREKDFIFTTVVAGWDDVLCNRYVFPASLLNQYVKSTNASAADPFKTPMLWSGVADGRTPSDLLPGGDLDLLYYEQGMSGSDGIAVTLERDTPSDITVLGATAASSAAAGVASSYQLYRRTFDFSQQLSNTFSNFLRNLSVPIRLTDSGFRSRENISSARYDDLAAERYLRISDGGIHDSTSVVALLHHLHRNDQLDDFEIILMDPMFFPRIACEEAQLPLPRSVAFLFGYSPGSPFLCLELGGVPGPTVCVDTDPCENSVPTAQIQVFRTEDWPAENDVAWRWKGIDEPTGQVVELMILSVDVITIDNPAFDIPAGRTGTMHVLSGSTEYQDGIPLSNNNLDSYDALYRSIRRALTDEEDDQGRLALFDALNTSPSSVCIGDIDGNAVVDGSDLTRLLAGWGGDSGPADLDGDGDVGGTDLTILLGSWGSCP